MGACASKIPVPLSLFILFFFFLTVLLAGPVRVMTSRLRGHVTLLLVLVLGMREVLPQSLVTDIQVGTSKIRRRHKIFNFNKLRGGYCPGLCVEYYLCH